MKNRLISLIILAIFLSASLLSMSVSQPSTEMPVIMQESIKAISLPETSTAGIQFSTFTKNVGQLDNSDVLFYSTMGNLAFTNNSLFIYSSEYDNTIDMNGTGTASRISAMSFSFVGANDAAPVGLNPVQWTSNYFLGNDADKWLSGVPNFQSLIYKNLWDGIDLEYQMNGDHLKYQFIVHPGSEPSDIAIRVDGHEDLYVMNNQELCIETGIGTSIVDSGLDVFYAHDNEAKINAGFMLLGNDIYSFDLGAWDNTRTMIIDPIIYSTFLGGTGTDGGNDIAVDEEGCAYVTGQTDSLSFRTIPGVIDLETRPSADLFVVKLNRNGTEIVYSSFIGGVEHDVGTGIAVDSQGFTHVTGITYSEDFPSTSEAYDSTYSGVGDAFIMKISQNGDSLEYSTFLGGVHDDRAHAIALDNKDQAYVTGETWSADFPVTVGALNKTKNGDSDIFVTKINQYGDMLDYSTFLGGTGSEQGTDISVDDEGCMFVTGTTMSVYFPVTTGANNLPNENAFVIKINKDGNSIGYSRLIGGSGNDFSNSIALDRNGNAYITGRTDSANFPTTDESYDENYNGYNDAFMTKLSNTGDSIIYSTYLGSTMDDEGTGISLEVDGTIYITGYSKSMNFPTTLGALSKNMNGDQDGFVARLDASSSLLYSTFLGGEDLDLPRAIVLSNDGCAYITGDTLSDEFPTTSNTYHELNNGGLDGFVTKLDIIIPVANAGMDIYVNESNDVFFNGTGSYDNVEIVNYTWSFNDGFQDMILRGPSPIYFFKTPGTYRINLKVLDQVGNMDSDTMYLRVLSYPYPVANAGHDIQTNQSASMNFNGSASRDNRGVISYRWTFNDGINNISLLGPSPAWIFTVPGTYEVMLNVTDAELNWHTDTMSVRVSDDAIPIVVIDADASILQGASVSLDGSASTDNIGIKNYTWTLNHNDTNITLYGPNQSFVFWTPGNYMVTLNVTDDAGNSAFNIASVTIFETEKVVIQNSYDYFDVIFLMLSILFLAWAIIRCWKRPPPNKQEVDE